MTTMTTSNETRVGRFEILYHNDDLGEGWAIHGTDTDDLYEWADSKAEAVRLATRMEKEFSEDEEYTPEELVGF